MNNLVEKLSNEILESAGINKTAKRKKEEEYIKVPPIVEDFETPRMKKMTSIAMPHVNRIFGRLKSFFGKQKDNG